MTRFRYKRKRFERMDELPLTPLIDTALTLLIVFIIAAPAIHNGIKIDLPQGNKNDEAGLSEKITVVIDKDKNIYLGTTKTDVKSFSHAIALTTLQEHKGIIYVQAEQSLAYGFIFDVIERLRCLEGVAHVVLVSKK